MISLTIEGTVENLGHTLTGSVGVEIRNAGGELVIVPGLSKDDIRFLAPLLFKRVKITVEEVT